MDCARVKTLLNEHIDGVLPQDSRTRVEDHLRSCPSCDCEFKGLLQLRSVLKSARPFRAPAGFSSRVMKRVRLEEKGASKESGLFGWIWEMPAYLKLAEAAAAVIVVTAGVYSAGFLSDRLLNANAVNEQAEESLELASLDAMPSGSMGDIYLSIEENGNEQ